MERKKKDILDNNEACCYNCSNFDSETGYCMFKGGKLYGIGLTDELANAKNDCQHYDEVIYRLSPYMLLKLALKAKGYDIEFDVVKQLFDEFMRCMINNGYLAENNEQKCTYGKN